MIDPWKFEKELGPPPKNYIPGIGRGAIGFTTRSDLGSVLESKEEEGEDLSSDKYDEWTGYKSKIKIEEEESKIWDEVDLKLKRKKNEKKEEGIEIIQKKFSDVKKGLEKVTNEEWMNIPEIGNYNIKKRKFETFTPLPDSVILQGTSEIREVKENILKNQLKKHEDQISGVNTVNPETYLLNMNDQMNDLNNLKRIKELLKNLTNSNPTNGSAWITAAKIEEGSGKLSSARNIIMKSLEYCYDQEDVWLEAARLNNPEISKSLLVKGVENLPKSIKLWICAANLEVEKKNKKNVYKKALNQIPNSVQLWKEAIELEENEEDVKIMLKKACEIIPNSYEFWITLSRLENYENAKKVLNTARKYIPTEIRIWITACELEEENGNLNLKNILEKGIKSLKQQNLEIEKEKWIQFAQECEKGKHFKTCKLLIDLNLKNNLENDFLKDSKDCFEKGYIQTSKYILELSLNKYPNNLNLLKELIQIESNQDLILNYLKNSFQLNQDYILFYIQKLLQFNQLSLSKDILNQSLSLKSSKIYSIGIKIYLKELNFKKIKEILELARNEIKSDKFWIKSCKIENILKNSKLEKEYIDKGLELYSNSYKLWILKGKYEYNLNNFKQSQIEYLNGLKNCPNSIDLWILAISLEEKLNNLPRARAMIEKAQQKNPKNEKLWLFSIEFEKRNGNLETSLFYLSKSLQEIPNSGLLWSKSILMENRQKQKSRCALALEKCDKNSHLFLTITILFWKDRKLNNTKEWFKKTILIDNHFGDVWIYYYKFILKEDLQNLDNFLLQFNNINPKYGDIWLSIKKDLSNFNLSNFDILKKGLEIIKDF